MDAALRDALLAAVHEVALKRYDQYVKDVGSTSSGAFIPFRAGYQNAIIDVLSGVFGLEAVTP